MNYLWVIYGYGWWLSHPSEKYESRLGLLFPTYGKITHVTNHQPEDGEKGQKTGGQKWITSWWIKMVKIHPK